VADSRSGELENVLARSIIDQLGLWDVEDVLKIGIGLDGEIARRKNMASSKAG